jgi:S1-C subfamily serine protease
VKVRHFPVLLCWVFSAAITGQTRNDSLLRPPIATPSASYGARLMTKANSAVVRVQVEVDNGRTKFAIERPSTGVLIAPSGLVLTWWDLVGEAFGKADKRVLVHLIGENEPLPATIVAHDEATTLALLQIDLPPGKKTTCLELATTAPLPGTLALVVARNEQGCVTFAGVTTPALGNTTVHDRLIEPMALVMTDARIDERCHGGALLSEDGQMIGLCNSEHVHKAVGEPKLADLKATNFGFSINSVRIREVFQKQLQSAAKVATAKASSPDKNHGGSLAAIRTAKAVADAAAAIVMVHKDANAQVDLGTEDPLATKRRVGVGSGVVLSANGLVITNHHLLAGAKTAFITLDDGRTLPVQLVQADVGSNLALLQCELPAHQKLTAIACGTDDSLPGALLLALGRPSGSSLSVSVGVLSARREGGQLQADANLGNANAGGALISAAGELLGVIDGGRVDMVDRMFQMQGDRAKTETNLGFAKSIAAIRSMFAAAIAQSADADESIRAPKTATAAELLQRAGFCATAMAASGEAMLNVYVQKSRKPVVNESDNPFAEAQPSEMEGESLGSGVIIDSSGLAISNWHVVDSATEPDGSMRPDYAVRARSFNGTSFDVQVLSISREDDLSLLQLALPDGELVKPVIFGDSAALQCGDGVLAIGNPLGLANTITAGIVTAKDQGIHVKGRWAKLENLIETDAAINGGNSGGALLDLNGRLVGINSAGSSGLSSRGYAIPVDHVRKQILGLLLTAEKLRSQSIGINVTDTADGVVIENVMPFSPAARENLQTGDRIRALNDTAIATSPDFALTLRKQSTGQAVTLHLERNGKPLAVKVETLSAAQWAVVRQAGIELETISSRAEAKLVQDAATALHRKFTGDTVANPAELPEQLLRIRRTDQKVADDKDPVKAGDLLLAVEQDHASAAGEAASLRNFTAVRDVQALFNDREHGSYDGAQFRCWIYRDGAVQVKAITARRLLP